MSKAKLLIENCIVYGLGGIISKIIPFIMLPIVTRMMPGTFYFGLNDLVSTIVSFASAFAIMGMYDAMFRMFFDQEDDAFKKAVCSTALVFVCGMAIAVSFALFFSRESLGRFWFAGQEYACLINISAAAVLVKVVNSIISAPTRMQNQRRIFLIRNAAAPIFAYGFAVPLLLFGHYAIALPLAAFMSDAIMDVSFFLLNRRWFSIHFFDFSILKQMLSLAVPIMPAFLIYWVFNSCDRIMIAQFLDVGQVGIYAIGAKLGAASQLIYTAFVGGWQYFAFSTMKEEKQVETRSAIYEYLGVVAFLAGMWMCGAARPLFAWLFPPDYLSGAVVVPYLFLSPLLLLLYQVGANQFIVIKKTWPSTLILFFGAFTNVALNYLLIPKLGIEGAALATLLGYVASDVICLIVLCRMRLMLTSKRLFAIVGITITYFMVWRLWLYEIPVLSLSLAVIVSIVFVFLYRMDLGMMARRVKLYIDARRKCA